MPVLYRKYRPQIFADVVNQKPVIQTLQNQLKSGKLSHAYLFTGSRGVGKTSVARILAKAVNCANSETGKEISHKEKIGEACGECGVCKAIEAGNFIDLIEIDAASNTGVDNVRDIIEHVKFAPSLGKYKVFIIDEVHMLSKGAFNALLKTLEEPPVHAIFVLATTEIQKVPATIISRTQRFDFKALSFADNRGLLEKVAKAEGLDYSSEILDLVAQNAQGSGRDALSILDKIATLGSTATVEDARLVLGVTDSALMAELIKLIAQGQAKDIPGFFDGLLEKGTDFSLFNKDFLEYLRKALVYKASGNENVFNNQAPDFLSALSLNDLMLVIRLFLKSFKDLQGAPSPEIPLLLAGIEAALRKPAAQTSFAAVPAPKQPKVESFNTTIGETEKNITPAKAEAVPAESFSYDEFSLDEVREFWPKVLDKIKAQNGPLGSLLKAAQLTAIESGRLVLLVKFEFDRKTLEKNTSLIMDIIKDISGKNLGISGRVQLADTAPNPVSALSDALKIFGGELVE